VPYLLIALAVYAEAEIMANTNPSQLLPSGQLHFCFFFTSFALFFNFLEKIISNKSYFGFFFLFLKNRANRQVHRVENMGHNERRQGACWYSQGFWRLCQHGPWRRYWIVSHNELSFSDFPFFPFSFRVLINICKTPLFVEMWRFFFFT